MVYYYRVIVIEQFTESSALLSLFGFHKFVAKDTLKAFDDFKNKQQKCMKQCFFDM